MAQTQAPPALEFSIVFNVVRADDLERRATRRRWSEVERAVQRVLNALHTTESLGPDLHAKKERDGAICFQSTNEELCLRCASPLYWNRHGSRVDAYGTFRFDTRYSKRPFTIEEVLEISNRLFVVVRDALGRVPDCAVEFDPSRVEGCAERRDQIREEMRNASKPARAGEDARSPRVAESETVFVL